MHKYIGVTKPSFKDWYIEYHDLLKIIYLQLKKQADKNECRLMMNCPYKKFCIFAYEVSF